jgi:hypothetical protein
MLDPTDDPSDLLLYPSGARRSLSSASMVGFSAVSIVTNSRGPTRHFREVYFWNGMKLLARNRQVWGIDKIFTSVLASLMRTVPARGGPAYKILLARNGVTEQLVERHEAVGH